MDPKGTFELLTNNEMINISGNQDRFILENINTPVNSSATLTYVNESLDDRMINWLQQLPFDFTYEDHIYCCHASPASDTIPLLEKIQPGLVSVKNNLEINELLQDIVEPVVLYGHSHVPRVLMSGEKMIVNPGSVGLPAYDDDSPVFHKMESFTPHARYSILTFMNGRTNVSQVAVSYDYEKAATMAEENNRSDWARWIRTGRA